MKPVIYKTPSNPLAPVKKDQILTYRASIARKGLPSPQCLRLNFPHKMTSNHGIQPQSPPSSKPSNTKRSLITSNPIESRICRHFLQGSSGGLGYEILRARGIKRVATAGLNTVAPRIC